MIKKSRSRNFDKQKFLPILTNFFKSLSKIFFKVILAIKFSKIINHSRFVLIRHLNIFEIVMNQANEQNLRKNRAR